MTRLTHEERSYLPPVHRQEYDRLVSRADEAAGAANRAYDTDTTRDRRLELHGLQAGAEETLARFIADRASTIDAGRAVADLDRRREHVEDRQRLQRIRSERRDVEEKLRTLETGGSA